MPPIALPETLATLDDVAENVRQFYEPGEDGVFKLANIEPLKNAMKNAKQERAQLAEELRKTRLQMEAFKGVDAAKYQQLLEREQQLTEFEQNKGGEIERLKAEMARTYDGKLSSAEQEKNRYRQAAESIARENLINSALARAGVNELGMKYLANQLAGEISFEWHGDRVVPKLLDANGAQRLHPETFDPMTLDDLLAQHRKEAPVFFNSQFQNGGGSGTSNTGGAEPPSGKPLAKFSTEEIRAFNRKHGDAQAYNRALLAESNLKNK